LTAHLISVGPFAVHEHDEQECNMPINAALAQALSICC